MNLGARASLGIGVIFAVSDSRQAGHWPSEQSKSKLWNMVLWLLLCLTLLLRNRTFCEAESGGLVGNTGVSVCVLSIAAKPKTHFFNTQEEEEVKKIYIEMHN